MINKEMKKRKLIKVSVEMDNSCEKVVEIDDSISVEELVDGDYSFQGFIQGEFEGEYYDEPYVFVEDIEEDNYKFEKEPTHFIYKNGSGDFRTGSIISEGSESIIFCHTSDWTSEFRPVCFSSPIEKTKELWNKGDIEELKSYFIPYESSSDVEDITKIYESRNGRFDILIQDKERYQKDTGVLLQMELEKSIA